MPVEHQPAHGHTSPSRMCGGGVTVRAGCLLPPLRPFTVVHHVPFGRFVTGTVAVTMAVHPTVPHRLPSLSLDLVLGVFLFAPTVFPSSSFRSGAARLSQSCPQQECHAGE